jgi:hypothetical protein
LKICAKKIWPSRSGSLRSAWDKAGKRTSVSHTQLKFGNPNLFCIFAHPGRTKRYVPLMAESAGMGCDDNIEVSSMLAGTHVVNRWA